MSFGVGIIGLWPDRPKSGPKHGEGRLVACADIDEARAKALAGNSGAKVFGAWRGLLTLPEVEIVVIATLHDSQLGEKRR